MTRVESYGVSSGLSWVCVASDMGHRCGYVAIPPGHALYRKDYSDECPGVSWDDLAEVEIGKRGVMSLICVDTGKPPLVEHVFDVHGSLTFSGENFGRWWLGFDCAHVGDAPDPSICSPLYARNMHPGDIVRSREYVEVECARLADQIAVRFPKEVGDE